MKCSKLKLLAYSMAPINPNLQFLRENIDKFRVFAHQGGTRSGKTYSILQWIIETCCQYSGMTISICRNEFSTLKPTAMRDFFEILENEGMYEEVSHNKTDKTYWLNGNLIEFFGLDQAQKVKGRKRHILYINEANEIEEEAYRQLTLRTTGKIILDYNPNMHVHWIYDKVLTRNDVGYIQTTYKDNPFLLPDQIAELERYKTTDYDYFRVYGLGERAKLRTGAEFYHAFNRGKHVKQLVYDKTQPIHLSFDFNVLPYMTLLCCQVVGGDGRYTFRFFREYCLKSPDNSSTAISRAFKYDYGHLKPVLFLYGDAAGKSRIAGQGNKRNFDDIEGELIELLHSASDRVLRKNPSVFKARDFINLIFAGHWPHLSIEIDEDCTELIKDLENVKISIDGKDKSMYSDKQLGVKYQLYGHTSDAMTYLLVSALEDLYKRTKG